MSLSSTSLCVGNISLIIQSHLPTSNELTQCGRVTHICVSKLTIIDSDNGLSPGRRQAIIWTNAGILLIWTFGTNFSEILGEIHSFSFLKMHLKMLSAKWRLFGLGLNELNTVPPIDASHTPAPCLNCEALELKMTNPYHDYCTLFITFCIKQARLHPWCSSHIHTSFTLKISQIYTTKTT